MDYESYEDRWLSTGALVQRSGKSAERIADRADRHSIVRDVPSNPSCDWCPYFGLPCPACLTDRLRTGPDRNRSSEKPNEPSNLSAAWDAAATVDQKWSAWMWPKEIRWIE